jgi:hypothetical protein
MALAFDEIMVSMNAKTTLNKSKQPQPRCEFCGRFFIEHPCQRGKQRACSNPKCKAARKKASQKQWTKKNPGYFKGRYQQTKEWREHHPGYQKARRRRLVHEIQDTLPYNSSIITIHLAVTDKRLNLEIQDALRREKACGRGIVVCGVRREIQDTLASEGLDLT